MDVFDPLKNALNRLNLGPSSRTNSRAPEPPTRTSMDQAPMSVGAQSSSSGERPPTPGSPSSSPPTFAISRTRSGGVGPRKVTRTEAEFYELAQSIFPTPYANARSVYPLDYGASALRETLQLLRRQEDDTDEDPKWTMQALGDQIIAYLQMQGPYIAGLRRDLVIADCPDRVFPWFQTVWSSLKTWIYSIQVALISHSDL
jgi:hypothetical protein